MNQIGMRYEKPIKSNRSAAKLRELLFFGTGLIKAGQRTENQ
jgi:hypothetical protein